jgi:hypothetical protein
MQAVRAAPASIKSAASKIRICLNLPFERFLGMLSRAAYLDLNIKLAFGSPIKLRTRYEF